MNELREAVKAFREERSWDRFHSPKNLAMALMVECAELVEQFQWLTEQESADLAPDKKRKVEEEIGDVLIYLVNLADKLEVDLLDAAWKKLEKNREKYPVDRVRGKSLKYNEYEK